MDTSDRIYVGEETGRVQVFDASGKFLGKWVVPPYPGYAHTGIGLGVDDHGNIYCLAYGFKDVPAPNIATKIYVLHAR